MKKVKGCLVAPQDEDRTALQSVDCVGPWSIIKPFGDQLSTKEKRGERLASSRVTRDNLMHQMETIVLQEAELDSDFELLDCIRQRCNQQHDMIVRRFEYCQELLTHLESNGSLVEEHAKWQQSKEMITKIFPEVLVRLEDNIELNNAKIRNVRDKIDKVRAKRLALREEIAAKEEEIALILCENPSYNV